MSKLIEFSLKLGFFLAIITGTLTIFFNRKKQQFFTSKFQIALNKLFTVIIVLGSFYSYHVNRDYKDTDDTFLKVTKFVYQVTKYIIVILMYSKPWISRQQLLEIFNNSYNLHTKFGGTIVKYKNNLITLLFLSDLVQVIVYFLLTIFFKTYESEFSLLEYSLYVFGSGMRYILNMYFIIIIWHEQLLVALETRIKYSVDKFMVYSMSYNVHTNKSKHMIECTNLCMDLIETIMSLNTL